jgi:hypothetical protein
LAAALDRIVLLVDPVPRPGTAILESFARVAVGTQLIMVIRFDAREYIGVSAGTHLYRCLLSSASSRPTSAEVSK